MFYTLPLTKPPALHTPKFSPPPIALKTKTEELTDTRKSIQVEAGFCRANGIQFNGCFGIVPLFQTVNFSGKTLSSRKVNPTAVSSGIHILN